VKVRIRPEDTAFSLYVRALADNKCEYCGGRASQIHHFHGRRKLSTRFDIDNVCPICFECHQMFHEHPNIQTEFWEKRLGSERYEQLNIRANMIKKMSKLDRVNLKNYYKEKIKELK